MSKSETLNTILGEASSQFAAQGYNAVSMRDIAKQLGMTPANLYHHFKDKEDLVRSSLAYVFEGKMRMLDDIVARHDDPLERLEMVITWFSTLLFEDEIFSRLLYRELLENDEARMKFLSSEVFQGPFSLLVQILGDCVQTEEPALLVVSVVSLIIGHVQIAKVFKHLKENKPEYNRPEMLTRHVMEAILRLAKPADAGRTA